MKVIFKKSDLLSAIKLASKFVNDLVSNAALGGILITAKKDGVVIRSSNNIASVEVQVQNSKILAEGEVLLKATLLSSVIPKIKGEEVEFNLVEGTKIVITSGKYFLETIIMDSTAFPAMSFDNKNWDHYNLTTNDFNQIAQKISTAALKDSSKSTVFTGVNFSLDQGSLRVTATDTFKFLSSAFKVDGQNFNITVETFILDFVKEIINDKKYKSVDFYIKEKVLIFKTENLAIKTKTIEGKYPAIEKILSIKPTNFIKLNREEMIEILERGLALGNTKGQLVTIESGNKSLKFTFKNSGIASSVEELSLPDLSTYVEKISLNSQYLLTLIFATSSKQILLGISGNSIPIKIMQENDQFFEGVLVHVVTR